MKQHPFVRIVCPAEQYDLLVAELSAIGFDSFLEEETYLEAYAPAEHYDLAALPPILQRYGIRQRPVPSIR